MVAQNCLPERSSAPRRKDRLPLVESTTQVERHYAITTPPSKSPSDMTFPKGQPMLGTRHGFLSRMVRGFRDAAFQVKITSPGRAYFQGFKILSFKEEAELNATLMGLSPF